MKTFRIDLTIDVDYDANFFELDRGEDCNIIKQLVQDCLYDLDDIGVKSIDVEEDY